jgi:hypothetical protein
MIVIEFEIELKLNEVKGNEKTPVVVIHVEFRIHAKFRAIDLQSR